MPSPRHRARLLGAFFRIFVKERDRPILGHSYLFTVLVIAGIAVLLCAQLRAAPRNSEPVALDEADTPNDDLASDAILIIEDDDTSIIIDLGEPGSDDSGLIIIDDGEESEDGTLIFGDSDELGLKKKTHPLDQILQLSAESVAVTGHLVGRAGLRAETTRSPFRGLARGRFGFELRPRSPWRLHADAWVEGRGALGLTDSVLSPKSWRGSPVNSANGQSRAELGEVYLRLGVAKGALTVGRQIFAWSRSEIAHLGDVLNPVDQRSGLLFSNRDTRLPVLSVHGRVLLMGLALQAVLVPIHELPRVPVFAAHSQGVDPTHGNLALATSPSRLGDPGMEQMWTDQRVAVSAPSSDFSSMQLAFRGTGSAGGIDLGAQLFWGYDPSPALNLRPAMARGLGLNLLGARSPQLAGELTRLCPESTKRGGCTPLSGLIDLQYQRTLIAQIDGAAMVGPAVLKIEISASPKGGMLPGSIVHAIDEGSRMLSSRRLSRLAAAISLESGYGEWLQGGFELIDIAFLDVPAGVRIARVEPLDAPTSYDRTVHRLAVACKLHGAALDRDVLWQLSALVSPLQRDLVLAPRLAYRALFGQELALGAEIISGPPGSFGGVYEDASRVYAEWSLSF